MKYKILVIFLFVALSAVAQQRVKLDLDRTVRLATDSSLSARRYQSVYDASRYQYLSWQASRKPQFSLESTPVMYERYMTQRYLSAEDVDVYRQQRMFYSQAGITATRRLPSGQIEVQYSNGVTEITTAEGLRHKLSYSPRVTDDYR